MQVFCCLCMLLFPVELLCSYSYEAGNFIGDAVKEAAFSSG